MLHETCHIVADAGGWTCKNCRAHWRTSFLPDTCADARTVGDEQRRADSAAGIIAALLGVMAAIALLVGLARAVTFAVGGVAG